MLLHHPLCCACRRYTRCSSRTYPGFHIAGGCQSGRRRHADRCTTPLLQCLSDLRFSHGKACTRKSCQTPPQDHPSLPASKRDLSSWSAVTTFSPSSSPPPPPPLSLLPPSPPPKKCFAWDLAPPVSVLPASPCFALSRLHLDAQASTEISRDQACLLQRCLVALSPQILNPKYSITCMQGLPSPC